MLQCQLRRKFPILHNNMYTESVQSRPRPCGRGNTPHGPDHSRCFERSEVCIRTHPRAMAVAVFRSELPERPSIPLEIVRMAESPAAVNWRQMVVFVRVKSRTTPERAELRCGGRFKRPRASIAEVIMAIEGSMRPLSTPEAFAESWAVGSYLKT